MLGSGAGSCEFLSIPRAMARKPATTGTAPAGFRMVDEVISIECGEFGEYFQLLSGVAKSIVGQGRGGV